MEYDVVRNAVGLEGGRDPEGEGQAARHTLTLSHHEAPQRLTGQHIHRQVPGKFQILINFYVGYIDCEKMQGIQMLTVKVYMEYMFL